MVKNNSKNQINVDNKAELLVDDDDVLTIDLFVVAVSNIFFSFFNRSYCVIILPRVSFLLSCRFGFLIFCFCLRDGVYRLQDKSIEYVR